MSTDFVPNRTLVLSFGRAAKLVPNGTLYMFFKRLPKFVPNGTLAMNFGDGSKQWHHEFHAMINTCMKINEVCSPLKCFLASIRVVLPHVSMNSKTMIRAESTSQALAMLTRTYGIGNVHSINQIFNESNRTCQIQQEAVNPVASAHTQQQRSNVAQIKNAQVQQQQQQRPRRRKISTQPIAYQLKHKLIQDRLSQQLMRQSNIVKPTIDDIRIARERVATELKRVDLQYRKGLERRLRKHH